MDEINYNQVFGLDEGSGNAGDGQPPESSGDGQNANAGGGSAENVDNPGGAGRPPASGILSRRSRSVLIAVGIGVKSLAVRPVAATTRGAKMKRRLRRST